MKSLFARCLSPLPAITGVLAAEAANSALEALAGVLLAALAAFIVGGIVFVARLLVLVFQ